MKGDFGGAHACDIVLSYNAGPCKKSSLVMIEERKKERCF